MITKINKTLAIISYCLLAIGFTACSPEDFTGADPNGLPTVSGIDFSVSVDQETNQMIAKYTPQPGTYPVWILDGTSYSTLQAARGGLQEQRGRYSHYRAASG